MSNLPNWHRYVYGALAALLSVLVLMQTGVIPLPAEWKYAPLALMVGIAFLKDFLPRVQSATGVNAPPILSPQDPTKPPRG